MGSKPTLQSPRATLAYREGIDPTVILLAGLQGAGEMTAAGKLALYLKEREVDSAVLEGMLRRNGAIRCRAGFPSAGARCCWRRPTCTVRA